MWWSNRKQSDADSSTCTVFLLLCSNGVLFSAVCACDFVYFLSENSITPEASDIIKKFSGQHPMVEGVNKFKNGYVEVHTW